MNFTEKLRQLVLNRNRSEVARAAGLSPTAIADYLQKGYIPRADNALALARALDVSLLWLVDDARNEATPPKFENDKAPALHEAAEGDLLRELARRMRLLIGSFFEDIEAASTGIDWLKLADDAAKAKGAENPMPETLRATQIIHDIEVKFNRILQDYDVEFFSRLHHDELPGDQQDFEAFSLASVATVFDRFRERVQQFIEAVHAHPEWINVLASSAVDYYIQRGKIHAHLVSNQRPRSNLEVKRLLSKNRPTPAPRKSEDS